MLDFFQYNNATGQLELVEPAILLTEEFEALIEPERNKCVEDVEGRYKLRAFKEFKYIYLMLNWKSPYADYPEQDRHKMALKDSKLTQAEFDDETFRKACRAFKEMKENDRTWKLLKSVYNIVDKLTIYFDYLVDLNERKEDGSPVFKAKDVIAEAKSVGPLLDEIKDAEIRYKKALEKQSKIKGDQTPGLFD